MNTENLKETRPESVNRNQFLPRGVFTNDWKIISKKYLPEFSHVKLLKDLMNENFNENWILEIISLYT